MTRFASCVGRRIAVVIGAALLLLSGHIVTVHAQDAPDPPLRADQPVRGVVLDGGGQPVAGAIVVAALFREGDARRDILRTDASGQFQTQFKYRDHPVVTAYHPELSVAMHWVQEAIKESGDVPLLLVKPEPFVARVQDAAGQPIAGAKVRVDHYNLPTADGQRTYNNIIESLVAGTPIDEAVTGETDADGLVRIPGIPAGAECMVLVRAAGRGLFRSMGHRENQFYTGSKIKPAVITLQPEARIDGRVTTKLPGVSVAGLKVVLQDSHNSGVIAEPYFVMTDEEGRFEFGRLIAGTCNVFLADHEPDGPWTYVAACDVETRTGEKSPVVIELIEGHLVEGVVSDTGGQPLAGAYVGVYAPIRPNSGAAIIGFRTKDDGKYRFHLPPGNAQIYLSGAPTGYQGRGGGAIDVPDGAGKLPGPTISLAKTRALQLQIVHDDGSAADDVELIRLGNEERFIDLKSRPLLPDAQGRITLRRDDPLGFVTGGRLAVHVRLKDGTLVEIQEKIGAAAELTIRVP